MPQPKNWSAADNAARSEDLAWMAQWHETPATAARRLGLTLGGLRKWCKDNDPEVLARLERNEQVRKGAVA